MKPILASIAIAALFTIATIAAYRQGIREGEKRERQFYAGKIVAFPQDGEQVQKMMNGDYGMTIFFEPKTYHLKSTITPSDNTFIKPQVWLPEGK